MSREALVAEHEILVKKYDEIKSSGLKLDISRGKPCTEQLNLSDGMLTVLKDAGDCRTEAGFDCRNYGLFEGVPEAQKLFSELWDRRTPLRLLGVALTDLTREEGGQISMFPDAKMEKEKEVDRLMDDIRHRFGSSTIVRGSTIRYDGIVGKKHKAILDDEDSI